MKKISSFILFVSLFFSCSQDGGFNDFPTGSSGVAGSYARFMIVGNYFYSINNEQIRTFDLSDPKLPELINTQTIGERIESIFNLDNRLFIGSGSGLYIYTIESDGIPKRASQFSYEVFGTTPCDPVVATDSFAYVTLNTAINRTCGRNNPVELNQLVIFDVTNIQDPQLIAEYEMELPKGIGIDDKTLFVCDDKAGLKIFDASNPENLKSLAHFDTFTAFDVIPLDGLLLVVGPENVYQIDYSDLSNIQLISTIPLEA